jgi:hypothetical protein
VLPPVAAAAYLVAALRHRRLPLAATGLVVLGSALGGGWWLRNLIVFGAVQPSGYGEAAYRRIVGAPRAGATTLPDFIEGYAFRISLRLWGGIGLPEGPVFSPALAKTWTIALVALAVAGVAFGLRARWGRATLAVLTLPALLTLALVAVQAHAVWARYGGGYTGVQGRYLYLGLAGVAVPFGVGLVRLAELAGRTGRAATRLLPAVLLVCALATQAVAWRTLVNAWWVPLAERGRGLDSLGGALDGIARWSPFPAGPTFAPFLLAIVLALVALGLGLGLVRGDAGAGTGHQEPVAAGMPAPRPS